MSTIEVDKIIPSSGTSLTIGDSGDTINISDGAALTVDTNTLAIDQANNRVGVATGSPSFPLHVSGKIFGTGAISSGGNSFELSDNNVTVKRATNDMTLNTGGTERMRIDSSGNVGIGTSSPQSEFHVDASAGGETEARVSAGSVFTKVIADDANGHSIINFSHDLEIKDGGASDALRFKIDGNGKALVGGMNSFTTSNLQVRRGGEPPLTLDRSDNDGKLVQFHQATAEEGSISVSGSTVSYNGFTGTHWSRLKDNSKPTILKGTILESLDEMCDWYAVEFETDDGTITQPYSLGSNNIGDTLTYNFNGKDYTAKIIKENDVKHTKCKISDTEASKAVYGLFLSWDNDDDTVNDMYVAQVGTFVIRIHKDETVAKGDLIQSKGDGTGKVQADDIMRSSTVAKVLSTTKIETYSDGSYIVPCSLHC